MKYDLSCSLPASRLVLCPTPSSPSIPDVSRLFEFTLFMALSIFAAIVLLNDKNRLAAPQKLRQGCLCLSSAQHSNRKPARKRVCVHHAVIIKQQRLFGECFHCPVNPVNKPTTTILPFGAFLLLLSVWEDRAEGYGRCCSHHPRLGKRKQTEGGDLGESPLPSIAESPEIPEVPSKARPAISNLFHLMAHQSRTYDYVWGGGG